MIYINPADIYDGPDAAYTIEDDNGPVSEDIYAWERDAIAAAVKLSQTFSDIYRIHDERGRLVALVVEGDVWRREPRHG